MTPSGDLTIHFSFSSALGLDFCFSVYLGSYSSSHGSSDAPPDCDSALFVSCSDFGSFFSPCSCSASFPLVPPLLLLAHRHLPLLFSLISPTYLARTASQPSFGSSNASSEIL